jgi:deoxyhypusine synthase
MSNNSNPTEPTGALDAVFVESVEMPEGSVLIQGPDFNKKLSLSELLGSYKQIGYQGSSLGEAIEIVKEMVTHKAYFMFIIEN